jgi:ribonuclease Y
MEISIIVSILGLVIGFVVSFILSQRMFKGKEHEAEARAKIIITDAEKTSETLKKEKLVEIKEELNKKKLEFELEIQEQKNKYLNSDKQFKIREEEISKKEKSVTDKLANIAKTEKTIEEKKEEISKLVKGQTQKLEKIASMSREEAKKVLIDIVKNEIKSDTLKLLNQAREEIKLKANQDAQQIVLTAIQRSATDYCIENTVSVVNLENDEMKGRIIGREGRNIRTFEAATGVDLIIDDTPEAVVISGFDPYRREIARKALTKLMHDGRIHPTRIEELVNKTRKELEDEMLKEGDNVLLQLAIHNIHIDIIRLIGRMRFRTSYGQNLLNHSIEVAYVAGVIAHELGLDARIAKRAALLHDIGKCLDKEIEGPHAQIGADLAKKYKENNIIVNAIAAHHDDVEPESAYAAIVQVADSISGSRPGARKESIENYVKRLEKLEEISNSFEGVSKTFAIQAGREIRVIVEPERVDDTQSMFISNEIAKRIESEIEYPGQIKVTVIREKRSIAVAK